MKTSADILIIGGGLAGLTAAIHLVRADQKVTLIERNVYPKHKVCGEYISNEVLPYLKSLDVDPFAIGSKVIDTFEFSTQTGKQLRVTLPLGGFGVSRYALDNYLYEKAVSEGVTIIHDKVEAVQFQNGTFQIETQNNSDGYIATYCLGAFGKRSNLDKSLGRSFMKQSSPWLGVKAHYKANFPENVVGLHHFEGGYCGLSQVETGAVNACYLAHFDLFQKYKDIDTFQNEVVFKNTKLYTFFRESELLFDKPLTISQISFASKPPVENGVLMMGDTAGLIHPLCGNGMAMAIHSAKIASTCIIDHLNANTSRENLEANYAEKWEQTFSKRLRSGYWLQRALGNRTLTSLGVRILQKNAPLLKRVITQTHGKPF